jgi:dTDP-glucose pyrophosphorylase
VVNILVPMAGCGSRFAQAGYVFPKPLIEIHGKPMIQVVLDNINIDGNYIFVVQAEHCQKYSLDKVLKILKPNCKIVYTSSLTKGAACTTLLAEQYINNNAPLIIANSDQYVEWKQYKFLKEFDTGENDGAILTFTSVHPKWSFVKINKELLVTEVAEKKPISTLATVGIYGWARGSDYINYARQMIDKNITTNGEFYVCPVFNEAIADRKKIKIVHIEKMYGLGTPEDLEYFVGLSSPEKTAV